MSAIIQVSGTAQEIIALAKTLEAGLLAQADTLTPQEVASLNADNIIGAIKLRRERTGCGLKEAKDFVEGTPEGQAWLHRFAERRDARGDQVSGSTGSKP